MKEWQRLVLGTEKDGRLLFCKGLSKSWGRRTREKLELDIYLNVVRNGPTGVIGYEMQITDNRQPTTAEVIQQAKEMVIKQTSMIF